MNGEELADVLSEFARTMVTDFPIQGILDHLVKRIVDVMPVTAAGVTLISPGLQPRYIAASNASALRFEKLQTEMGEGPCLAAYDSGEAISAPDLRLERRFPKFTPRALEAGLAAAFTFPLRHADVQLGALDLYRETPGALTAESMTAAQTLADVAAAYLINAQARSDLEDSSDQSREAALHDPLTGLPNRVLMLQLLEHAFRRARRSGNPAAVLFVDLDQFKEINDAHGHRVGDQLLVAVAERMTEMLRPGDSLSRLSGDEFVALCEELHEPGEADLIARRFDAALREPFRLPGVEVTISASIGIAFAGQGSDVVGELLHAADLAMYEKKRDRGGERDVLDLRGLHLAEQHAGLAHGLPGARERGELHIDYQPIVETRSGCLTGVEALMRWTHPSRGLVSPTVFIPFAEQSGQIIDLGRWVLEQACLDRDHCQRRRAEDITIAVNVSAYQFMSSGFADTVATVLASSSTRAELLTLEITERVFFRDETRALVVLDELKDIGVSLALDDFGTGYSSLGYLNKLPIDRIKLDRSFVTQLTDTPESQTMLKAIIQLAHSLGLTVVCEGVETVAQYGHLAQLGVDACQGFYFGRPMAASSLETLIGHHAGEQNSPLP